MAAHNEETLTRAATMRSRVLSFGRRPRQQSEKPERRMSGTAAVRSISFGRARNGVTTRTTSFGRARRMSYAGPSIREVTVYKNAGDVLGMTLAKPGLDGFAVEGQGVLVSRIAKGGAVAKSKRISAGDTICAVNGVSCLDYRHCAEQLRSAEGLIQLVVATAGGLPDGWEQRMDRKGVTYYRNAALRCTSYDHPSSIPAKNEDARSPAAAANALSPRTRWRSAFHTVALVNSLAGETEPQDCTVNGSSALVPAVFQTLQRERV